MNNIHASFCEVSQQTHMYEQVAIITQMWHGFKCLFPSISNAWYPITVPRMNKITTLVSEILEQTFKMYEKIATITQILTRSKCYFKWITSPWYLITVLNMRKIYPAIMEECARMDRQMNGLTDQARSFIRQFHYWAGHHNMHWKMSYKDRTHSSHAHISH